MNHSQQQAQTPTIVVLGTGGTISCTHDAQGDVVPTYTTQELLEQAGCTNNPDVTVHAVDLIQLDSSNLTLNDIDHITSAIATAIADQANGIILLHGTDTMEETAMAIHRFFHGTVPIVLTGAQRPADDPNPDGPANINQAIQHILHANTGEATVSVAFGGNIHSAYGISKRHTTDDDAFSNQLEQAIRAGQTDATSIPHRLPHVAALSGLNVPIVTMYAGADATTIPTEFDGLVFAALGSGNIPTPVAEHLEHVLAERNAPVIICTRVPEGSVHFVYGGAGGGAALKRAGFRSGGYLRPSQARIALLCELAVART